MNWVMGFARVTCLAMPLAAIAATTASAMPVASPTPAASRAIATVAMTDDEKRAKATDCSRQADAKKLHGEARRKFRASCKKM